MDTPAWLKFKKKDSGNAVHKLLVAIRKKTSGFYTNSRSHWLVLKVSGVVVVLLVAFFAYLFYERVNLGAFESSADVVATGVQDINAQDLLDVLITERARSVEFANTVGSPVVSFDPSFYDVELRLSDDSSSTATTTEDLEE